MSDEIRVDADQLANIRASDASGLDDAAAERPRRPGRRRDDLVRRIREGSRLPSLEIRVGPDVLLTMRPGSVVTLVGGTGRGKTSLAAQAAVDHARDTGPAIVASLELPDTHLASRIVGVRTDTSWLGVLEGEVSDEDMARAIPDRLSVIDRDDAGIDAIGLEIDGMRAEYPDQPILVVVDYVQIYEASGVRAGELRASVDQVMRALGRLAIEREVVVLALSQGSRGAMRAVASGERTGADTVDAGAESAAIERWASATVTIGALGEAAEDGSRPTTLELGKVRMARDGTSSTGDSSVPARYWGRSGLWRLTGDARPASEVREQRAAEQNRARVAAAKLAMVAAAAKASESLTHDTLRKMAAVNRDIARVAIGELIDSGELVRVRFRKPRARDWQVWTPEKAEKAGLGVVND